ncbi:type II secretion system protein N [Sulfitobacter sp.]|jgi:general secretion pathway protein C|uniref:type II secretion system protein N n=1 Tax=Sulfitobacter sp. TaxID=1903071 RepID=UPI000C0DED96|nr:hypothetical protein [Roseobacter sp.]MBV50246.1 hypothetical protein [Roseobacter sp.]PHR10040.1 MAG: hypothetical protein COB29_01420 [Sulfitobacter sp.]|tara:strand:+ start:30260 stop:31138 length:879 start_codon:yes stop_codon:yes gene_type:complete
MKSPFRFVTPVFALCITASLGIAAGPVFWHIMGQTSDKTAEVSFVATSPSVAPASVDLVSAVALAPFGSAKPDQQVTKAPEKTTLDLALRGILQQSDPSLSFALIATDGTTLRYAIGDSIAGKATLIEINDRHVVLDVDGVRQILGFPNADIADLSAGDVPAGPTPLSNLDRLQAALSVGSGSIEIEDPPPPETTEEYISMWRERIIRNPNQVLDEIGLLPTEKGYIVDETHDPGVNLAGLKAGDLVARVNGQTVGNTEEDRKFFDEVAASGVARLEVVRDDKTFVLSFPLR